MSRSGVVAATIGLLLLAVPVALVAVSGDSARPLPPDSSAPAPAPGEVAWMWSGAVTDHSVRVRAGVDPGVRRARLVVTGVGPLTDGRRSPAVRPRRGVASLSIRGLRPDTRYRYALELDGRLDRRVGRFRTFPAAGRPASFSFTLGACSRTGSDSAVYDALRRTPSLFHLVTGDWFYDDLESNDRRQAERIYTRNLTSPAQAAFYASRPVAYVWDDHDSGGNNADRTAGSWPAIHATYRGWVPHYPLSGRPQGAIHQAFTVGDVRFVLTDSRSARDPSRGARPSMLGGAQRRWLLRELADADRYGLVVWMNGVPWVDEADPGSDNWGGYARERRTIADAIARNRVDNLLMVSGDAHMLAYDDGTHTDYSRSGRAAFPLFHAAAVDRRGSIKGGPYTGPVLPGSGQFGQVRVHDDGRAVRVTVVGRDWKGKALFRRTFTARR